MSELIRVGIAKLDYPPAPVMMTATLVCAGFIFVGGYLFKRADEKQRAIEKARRIAKQNPQ